MQLEFDAKQLKLDKDMMNIRNIFKHKILAKYSLATFEKSDLFSDNQSQGVQKFKVFIARNFLSKDLNELRQADFKKIGMFQFLNLTAFKVALNNVYEEVKVPGGKNISDNIGTKYIQAGINQFKNNYLRQLASLKPQYNDLLRVEIVDQSDTESMDSEIHVDESSLPDEANLNKIFSGQVKRRKFFTTAKKQYLTDKEMADYEKDASLIYFRLCEEARLKSVIVPEFVQIQDRVMFLFDKTISDEYSVVLQKFLIQVGKYQPYQLREIVIDSCKMSDEALSNILNGAYE